VTVQLFFSGWHILGKIMLNSGTNPLIFAVFREVSASILMIGVFYMTEMQKDKEQRVSISALRKEDIPRVLFLGLCSFTNVVGFVVALSLTSAANCAAAQPTIPVFACLMAVIIKQELLTAQKGVGILVSAGGAIAVALAASEADASTRTSQDVILGNVVLVVQCFGMAALLVFQKAMKYPAPLVSLYFYSTGTLMTVLVSIYYVFTDITVWEISGSSFWVALGYTAVFSTAYNMVVMAYTVKILNSTLTSLYSALQPVGTVVLSVIFLGSSVTVLEVVAGVLVIAGLLVTTQARLKEQREAEAQNLLAPSVTDSEQPQAQPQ